ncbi:hypothetical protein [Acidovorax sp. FHTAMBA]|uniref:hypothetical protein n=1 Tax=Acidovorax sp. FHTAMBA TaxID=3140252 RepID=UPI003182CBF3
MIESDTVDQIRQSLEKFWEEESLGLDAESTSIDGLVAAMDSMTAVSALIDIEKIVGMELPTGEVIRRGGYDSMKQFMDDLSTRVIQYVKEHSK